MLVFNKKSLRFYMVSTIILLLTACGEQQNNYGFDFADLEQLESTEQAELLALTEQAARSYNFSQARTYLAQAKQKGYAQTEIANTEKILTANIKSYEAQQAGIRKAEQERKAQEEAQRLAQQRSQQRNQNSTGSSSGGAKSIIVTGECIGAFCTVKTFKVTGGPGGVGDGYNTGYINDYGQGVAGTYYYSATLNNNRHCSGSFRVTGSHKQIIVNMYEHNCESYLSKF
jgi:hypothetical protein